MAREKFERTKPHVNIGTYAHMDVSFTNPMKYLRSCK